MFHCDALSRPATFNLQKTGVTVGHVVRAADRIVVGWTDLLAAPE